MRRILGFAVFIVLMAKTICMAGVAGSMEFSTTIEKGKPSEIMNTEQVVFEWRQASISLAGSVKSGGYAFDHLSAGYLSKSFKGVSILGEMACFGSPMDPTATAAQIRLFGITREIRKPVDDDPGILMAFLPGLRSVSMDGKPSGFIPYAGAGIFFPGKPIRNMSAGFSVNDLSAAQTITYGSDNIATMNLYYSKEVDILHNHLGLLMTFTTSTPMVDFGNKAWLGISLTVN